MKLLKQVEAVPMGNQIGQYCSADVQSSTASFSVALGLFRAVLQLALLEHNL